MNDPNGAIHQAGRFHLFYQHNPFGDVWENMHWGHAVSPDLVRWEHRGIALAPRVARGEDHCFSGSAWRDGTGRPMLFYSSFRRPVDGCPGEQWAVRCDPSMERCQRVGEEPVLSLEGHDGPDFRPGWRDPFVFGKAGRTFLALGAERSENGERSGATAEIALYESADDSLLRWRYRGPLYAAPDPELGFLECPNLLRHGDDEWLLYSAHRPVEWIAGCFDPETGRFEAARPRGRVDESPNFYATTRIAFAPGGRLVLLGWVRGWRPGRGWNGILGLPREIRAGAEGELLQAPVAELTSLRAGPAVRTEISLRDDRRGLEAAVSAQLELGLRVRPGDAARCGLRFLPASQAEGEREETASAGGSGAAPGAPAEPSDPGLAGLPGPDPHVPGVALRRVPGGHVLEVGGLRAPLPSTPGGVELTIFWDRSVLEVFASGGRLVCTRVFESAGEPRVPELFAEEGSARFESVRAWPLRGIW